MTKRITLSLLVAFLVGATVSVMYWRNGNDLTPNKTELASLEDLALQRQLHKRKYSYINPMGFPHKFFEIAQMARTGPGETKPSYPANYRITELQKLRSRTKVTRSGGTDAITWTERGPVNVPGRTRTIAVVPTDATGNTWLAGSVSGGIWKTTNGGDTWTDLSSGMLNLSISSIVISPSNPNVIYAGTGESTYRSIDAINGAGMFKSIDAGATWFQVASTTGAKFTNVTRIVVNPDDENNLVISTVSLSLRGSTDESGIYRSTDGGDTWTQVFAAPDNGFGGVNDIQTIVATPGNFAVQYASINSVGVVKSIDGGQTWGEVTPGATFGSARVGRIELAVANINTDIVYAGVESSAGSGLYLSEDAGVTWVLVNDTAPDGAPADWLATQGGYDNTILVHPYNDLAVYLGGIQLWRVNVGTGTTFQTGVLSVLDETTDFMALVSVTDWEDYGARLDLSNTLQEDRFASIEIRFGPNKKQMAHRFEVPPGGGAGFDGGAGVPTNQYSYKDYVEVPFEVWDIDNDKQLMVSFRDQERDGAFNLNPRDDENDPNLLTTREYIYIHALDYDEANPSSIISKNGGQEEDYMYNIWPYYVGEGETWDPSTVTQDVVLRILYGERTIQNGSAAYVTDFYQRRASLNSNVHPDHHFLAAILSDDGESFKLLNGNDGGVYVSKEGTNPATETAAWTKVGIGYNTTQFYGADKKPGEDIYIGGAQDNGSYVSREVGSEVTATTEYEEVLPGDGFEALWHATDPKKAIVSQQGNGFARTTNGFSTDPIRITGGFNDGGTFISRIANSPLDPNLVHTYGSSGPWYSVNFGSFWKSSNIDNDTWLFTSLTDIESSLANPDIVWTGGAMGTFRGKGYHVHVSTDGGRNYTAVSDFGDIGITTSLSTHPFDAETAYVMFSSHNSPKVLRTTDLGQTWEDISGFSGGNTSTNGFPNVAVNALLVLPHEPNTIWVGTEIGIVESNDDGATWHILDAELPAVSIWSMKVVDDQVVIATHGRGIWTATIPELLDVKAPVNVLKPSIVSLEQSEDDELKIKAVFNLRDTYDDVDVVVNNAVFKSIPANSTKGEINYEIDVAELGIYNVQLKAHKDGEEFLSEIVTIELLVLGLNDPEISRSVSVFPNPTSGNVNLRIENVLNGDLKVSVYNTAGQRVFTKSVRKNSNVFEMPIDFSQMAAGSYVVEVINGTERITKKVIRTK